MLGTQANAKCIYSGGTCIYVKGVECETETAQSTVGSLSKHPEYECVNDAPGLACITCKNPGKKANLSPGIQEVCTNIPATFSSSTSITRGNINNGRVDVSVITSPDLNSLRSYCPNSGWTVADYVPCYVNPTVMISNDSGTLSQATYQCVLPSCVDGTIGFDPVTGIFNREQYLDANDPTNTRFCGQP
jgi:hypothetical protein